MENDKIDLEELLEVVHEVIGIVDPDAPQPVPAAVTSPFLELWCDVHETEPEGIDPYDAARIAYAWNFHSSAFRAGMIGSEQ